MTLALADGWHRREDNGGWLYYEDGEYKAWVTPKAGLYVCSWRLADGSWPWPYGEDPAHVHPDQEAAMEAAVKRVEYARRDQP